MNDLFSAYPPALPRDVAPGHSPHAMVATAAAVIALALLGGTFAFLVSMPARALAAADAPAVPAVWPTDCIPGNLVGFAHTLIVPARQWLCGDVDAFGGGARVLGRIDGSVTTFGGPITVAGEVDGNVTAFGGDIDLAPTARIMGDVRTWGGTLHRAATALVFGNVERGDRLAGVYGSRWVGLSGPWSFPWPWVVGWALLAAVVTTLFPDRTVRVQMVARHAAVRSLVVGVLTAILGLGLVAFLFVTCFGIPISLLVLAVLVAGLVLGNVAVGLWLGERIVRTTAARQQSPLLPALVGVAILASAESIPALGGAIAFIVSSLGLGAALLSRFGARRPSLPVPAATPPRT
jgi:hypothetical protein